MELTLRHLAYFDALCAHGHFGRAAAACHVSQPALSVRIREMETLLGAPLIDRTARPFRPTPFGNEALAEARSALSAVRRLEQGARRRRGLEGPFSLGVIPTVAPYLLPLALPRVRRRLPGMELRIREAMTQELLGELADGALDACVLATDVEDDALRRTPLFRDRFLLALQDGQARALGLTDGRVRPGDMAALRMLLLSEGHCLREQAQSLCRFARQDVLNQIGASSLHTLTGLAASGYGATLLPEIALDAAMIGGPLAILRLVDPQPERTISLVAKRHMDGVMDLRALRALLAEAGALRTLETRRLLDARA